MKMTKTTRDPHVEWAATMREAGKRSRHFSRLAERAYDRVVGSVDKYDRPCVTYGVYHDTRDHTRHPMIAFTKHEIQQMEAEERRHAEAFGEKHLAHHIAKWESLTADFMARVAEEENALKEAGYYRYDAESEKAFDLAWECRRQILTTVPRTREGLRIIAETLAALLKGGSLWAGEIDAKGARTMVRALSNGRV